MRFIDNYFCQKIVELPFNIKYIRHRLEKNGIKYLGIPIYATDNKDFFGNPL